MEILLIGVGIPLAIMAAVIGVAYLVGKMLQNPRMRL